MVAKNTGVVKLIITADAADVLEEKTRLNNVVTVTFPAVSGPLQKAHSFGKRDQWA